jgi:hypothetical protein
LLATVLFLFPPTGHEHVLIFVTSYFQTNIHSGVQAFILFCNQTARKEFSFFLFGLVSAQCYRLRNVRVGVCNSISLALQQCNNDVSKFAEHSSLQQGFEE